MEEQEVDWSRRNFLKTIGTAGLGLSILPAISSMPGSGLEFLKSAVVKSGKAQHLTLLHTADIHGLIKVHDEFFWEEGKAVFKKRGGFAHLKTMISELRKQNANTLLMDGGDCFQGSAITSYTRGQAMVPLMNNIGYDLVLPGNWEVVYGKKMLLKNMQGYTAKKVCANMFNEEDRSLMFPPHQVFEIGGIKVGIIGYNDPLTPIRQPPAYSRGIHFEDPSKNIAHYIQALREKEGCQIVIALTHMGLAQQVHLAGQPYAKGLDYVFGGDTHERIRKPLAAEYAKVTEPGAFASFVGKLDLIIEAGIIKDEVYELLEVDPEKYTADSEMAALVEKTYRPYKKRLARVIGQTKTPLMRYYVLETPMDNLITDAVMWKVNPDISLSNGFRFCPPLVPDEKTGYADITLEYLWSMLPVNSEIRMAEATGRQILDWLEKEIENVFAKDATKRFGGWLVRFQGMTIKFTIGNEPGQRLLEVKIKGQPLDVNKTYTLTACEREGDPENIICRINGVQHARNIGFKLHDVIIEYLKAHSPVSPKQEGRAIATDAPSTLLTQLEGLNYTFR